MPTFAYKQAWEGYALGYGAAAGVVMLIVLVGVTAFSPCFHKAWAPPATLPVGLQTFLSSIQVRWGLITAGTVSVITPTVLLFAVVQRRLAVLTSGAVKS